MKKSISTLLFFFFLFEFNIADAQTKELVETHFDTPRIFDTIPPIKVDTFCNVYNGLVYKIILKKELVYSLVPRIYRGEIVLTDSLGKPQNITITSYVVDYIVNGFLQSKKYYANYLPFGDLKVNEEISIGAIHSIDMLNIRDGNKIPSFKIRRIR